MTEKEFLEIFFEYITSAGGDYLAESNYFGKSECTQKAIDDFLTAHYKEYYKVEFIKRDLYNDMDDED